MHAHEYKYTCMHAHHSKVLTFYLLLTNGASVHIYAICFAILYLHWVLVIIGSGYFGCLLVANLVMSAVLVGECMTHKVLCILQRLLHVNDLCMLHRLLHVKDLCMLNKLLHVNDL